MDCNFHVGLTVFFLCLKTHFAWCGAGSILLHPKVGHKPQITLWMTSRSLLEGRAKERKKLEKENSRFNQNDSYQNNLNWLRFNDSFSSKFQTSNSPLKSFISSQKVSIIFKIVCYVSPQAKRNFHILESSH